MVESKVPRDATTVGVRLRLGLNAQPHKKARLTIRTVKELTLRKKRADSLYVCLYMFIYIELLRVSFVRS